MSGSGLDVCLSTMQHAGGNALLASGTDLSGHLGRLSKEKHSSQRSDLTVHMSKTDV